MVASQNLLYNGYDLYFVRFSQGHGRTESDETFFVVLYMRDAVTGYLELPYAFLR